MRQTYVALDIETSGLNVGIDRILEIGAVRVMDGAVQETFHTLVNAGIAIPQKITSLTGITNEMEATGIEIKQALEQFVGFCGDDVLLGHNIIFDYSFIKKWAVNYDIPFEKEGIDTLKIARKLLPDLKKRSLDYLCEYFAIHRDNRHRAYDDALAASALYELLSERINEENRAIFLPQPLKCSFKKQTPITARQAAYLKSLAHYHHLQLNIDIDRLTRNEASRAIDRIILEHGKIGS